MKLEGLRTSETVSLMGLKKKKFCQVLCYPRCEQEEMASRLKELKRLGIKSVEFVGEKRIFEVPVLGKGCVGIVVVAYTNSRRAALKIRRVDADRKGMFHEGEMLNRANAAKVGPKLLEVSKNFLLMEFVEGTHFPQWIENLNENCVQPRARWVMREVLEQCFRLDEAGLDHGELSNAPKHIIVDVNDLPQLVDFETASINRRVSNVTSVCQYFFMRSQVAEKIAERLDKVDEKELIKALQFYKRDRTRENFGKILERTGL